VHKRGMPSNHEGYRLRFVYRHKINKCQIAHSPIEFHLHCIVGAHREEMVITAGKMWRTDNHQTANITIRRDVADFRLASGTEKSLAFHFRVANAEA